MANATEFLIKRLDDATIFSLLKAAEEAGNEALSQARNDGTLSGKTHELKLVYNSLLPWRMSDDDFRESGEGQYALGRASLRFTSITTDRNQQRSDTVTFEIYRGVPDRLNDNFSINVSNQYGTMNGDGEQSVQRTIHKSLSIILRPLVPEDGGLIPTLSNLSEAFDTTYRRIANELSLAVESVSRERASQLTEFQEERKKLREEMLSERESLLRTAKEAIELEKNEIEKERLDIEQKRARLEISSHKDARRKQFSELQETLKTSLASPIVDNKLNAVRWAVFSALILSGGAAAFFAYLSFNFATWEAAIPSSAVDRFSTTLMLVLRSVILTVASLISFFGAAAWMRYFYNRDLVALEEMRRFRNDMARASWVMEAALEIRKEHDEEIPPEWIRGVTEGLFAASKKESLQEGAQALAALMGLSAGANIGPNGVEVQLSRRGRKAIAEAANEA